MDMNYRWGMWEGGGGQDGVEWGREWDNCNSIINKYIFKKLKKEVYINDCFLKIQGQFSKNNNNKKPYHLLSKQKPDCKTCRPVCFQTTGKHVYIPHSICHGVGRCALSSAVTSPQTGHTLLLDILFDRSWLDWRTKLSFLFQQLTRRATM